MVLHSAHEQSPKPAMSAHGPDQVPPLKLTIVSARGLRDADWVPGAGKSDPYCTCEIAGKPKEKLHTKVINDNLDPVWEHQGELPGFRPGDTLVFKVYDKDLAKSDLLGQLKLESAEFYPHGFEGEKPLADAGKGHHAYLKLKIHPTMAPTGASSAQLPHAPSTPTPPSSGTSVGIGGHAASSITHGYPPSLPSGSSMVPSEPVASHHRLPTAEPMTGHRPTEPGPTSNWGSNMLVSPGPSATAMSGRLQSPVAPNSGARLRLEAGHRAGSTPGNRGALVASRMYQENNGIMQAVKRQVDGVEEKLTQQINRVQHQSDRLRDAAYARVDQKMSTMEALQPKFDRRLAELSGNYKGLSDEMQAQIKRVDQLDSRLWEWRHQLEEEMRSKLADIEQRQQEASSQIRLTTATNDDSIKRANQRLLRLERLVEERLSQHEDTGRDIMHLHDRLSEVEAMRMHELPLLSAELPRALREPSEVVAADSTQLAVLENRLSEAYTKIDTYQQERHELHMRVQEQEERLTALRTVVDAKEERLGTLFNRVERMDMEHRFRDMQSQLQELHQTKSDHEGRFELLRNQIEGHQQVQDDHGDYIRRLQATPMTALSQSPAEPMPDQSDIGLGMAPDLTIDVQECLRRLHESEAKLESIAQEVQAAKGENELGPRVAVLVEQLKAVAPKVMDQEQSVRDLTEKVGQIEVKVDMEGSGGINRANVAERITKLEADLARLKDPSFSALPVSTMPPSSITSSGGLLHPI